MMMRGQLLLALLLAVIVAHAPGCVGESDEASNHSFDLPPMGGGKADDLGVVVNLRFADDGILRGVHTGEFNGEGPYAVAFTLDHTGYDRVGVHARLSAGEPHVFLRRAPSEEVLDAGHGEGTQETTIHHVANTVADETATYQVVLFVTGASVGTYELTLEHEHGCRSGVNDTDAYEELGANNTPADATSIQGEFVSAVACNSLDQPRAVDQDYYSVSIEPNETLEVAMYHHEPWCPLALTVDGPSGPLSVIPMSDGTQVIQSAEPGTYTLGVGGDGPYNLYQIAVCVDDRLERMSGAADNDVPERAARLSPGTYSNLMLCSYEFIPSSFMLEPPGVEISDMDYYEVDVAAYHMLRVTLDERTWSDGFSTDLPEGMVWQSASTLEMMPSQDQTVRFGVGTAQKSTLLRQSDGFVGYDMTIEIL